MIQVHMDSSMGYQYNVNTLKRILYTEGKAVKSAVQASEGYIYKHMVWFWIGSMKKLKNESEKQIAF